MVCDITINPSPAAARALSEGVSLNNQGRARLNQGDYEGAERFYRRALELKLAGLGVNNSSTALSYNALGEAYIKLGRLDEAEDHVKKAVSIAMECGPSWDLAYYRENLGVVYEMKGDLKMANEIRRRGASDGILCAYEKVI